MFSFGEASLSSSISNDNKQERQIISRETKAKENAKLLE